jgi:hypothetical protein
LNGQLTTTESAHFAERALETAGPDPDRQITTAFALALSRDPGVEEKSQARTLFENASPKEALSRLGSVLFNLNEFIYLE